MTAFIDNLPSTYVEEKDRDTHWYIFHKRYMCRVPMAKTMSPEYIREYGIPTSGDREIDRQMMNELVDQLLTINQITEYFKRGVVVRVKRPEDTVDMYNRISDHLNAWAEQVKYGFHLKNVPSDDLITLDRLADSVYQHAKNLFKTPHTTSALVRLIQDSSSSLDYFRSFKLKDETTNNGEATPDLENVRSRASLVDLFNNYRGD